MYRDAARAFYFKNYYFFQTGIILFYPIDKPLSFKVRILKVLAFSGKGWPTGMKIIKESELKKELKSPNSRAYLFFGEEDYMKNYYISAAKKQFCVDEALLPFNEIQLDSFTYSPSSLLDAMMPLPMMSDRKLIIISGLDFNSMKQGEIDGLCSVLSQLDEYDYNTIIINTFSDRFDGGIIPKRPSSLLNKLSEYLTPVYFEKNTPSRLSAWVKKHYEHNGVSANNEVCTFTVEYCGRDMFSLASETDKISYYVLSSGRVNVEKNDVKYISSNTNEYDAFAFTNAIGSKDRAKATDILNELKNKKTDPIMIMSSITGAVCDIISVSSLIDSGLTNSEISSSLKMHEYRVSLISKNRLQSQAAELLLKKCVKADLDIKSSTDGYRVLENLICTM